MTRIPIIKSIVCKVEAAAAVDGNVRQGWRGLTKRIGDELKFSQRKRTLKGYFDWTQDNFQCNTTNAQYLSGMAE